MSTTGLDHYFGRLERALKTIALRLRLLLTFEFILRLASVFLIILLGSLIVQGEMDLFPYLPFVYYLLALVVLFSFFSLELWRIASGVSTRCVARGLEEKFPRLKDDVTNSLLLFHKIKRSSGSDQISGGLVTAHLRKTVEEVSTIHPKQAVNFRRVWSHLRLILPLFIALTVVLTMDPHFINRSLALIFNPFSTLPDRETFISLEPAPSIALRGTPVMIKAKATGYIPDQLRLRIWQDKSDVIHLDMASEGNGGFIHRIYSAQTSFRYQVFSDRAHSAIFEVKVVDAPDIGKIKLTLIPPNYTRLPREVKEGGHIEALKGTVVNLEAWATKKVEEGRLILDKKDHLLLRVEGDYLKGNLLVFNPGTYSLWIKDKLGLENPNPAQYRIHLIPDKYPEGEILSPTEDMEVASNEVLPVLYTVRDDFDVTAIRLIYQIGRRERFITLKSNKESPFTGPELYKWDLSYLAMAPGERVAFRLAVWDNDSISGPKVGYSRTLTLHVRDEKDRVSRQVERAQEIADALLDLLADQLEEIKDRHALSLEIAKIMKKVDSHLEQMARKKIERFELESLKRNLDTLYRRMDRLPRETITQEMERLALLAEDLAKKARMNKVEALTREIKNRQRRLIDSLRESKGPLSPDALQDMLKELGNLKDLISQVMEAMSRMATQLPDEFINSPDLSGLEFQDLFKDLQEIQKKLMEGDLAGALKAAQNLLQTLSRMMTAMAMAGNQARMGSFNRLHSEMSRQTSELEKILAEQKEILSETDSVDQELKRLIEEETEDRLDEMVPFLREALDKLRPMIRSEEGDPVLEMENLLEEGQIERLLERSESLRKELSRWPDGQKILEELMRMTRALTPDPKEVMTEESSEEFPELSSWQEKLRKRTKGLGDLLQKLSQLFPGMDTQIMNDLKDGAGAMGRASGKLKQEDASGAIPPEQEAIQSLTRSQQAMQQMVQQMTQQMAMGMQANPWAYPWGYDPRGGWVYGPWGPMPTLPQPEVKRSREEGYTGIDRKEFDPPEKDASNVPLILREKVMEALKKDIPSRYRQEVENYFKGLTE